MPKQNPDIELWNLVSQTVTPLGRVKSTNTYTCRCSNFTLTRSSSIDLHGHTVQEAHDIVKTFIQQSQAFGLKSVTVITGKSGQIRKEFPEWARAMDCVRSIRPHRGDGSFSVKFKSKKSLDKKPKKQL